MNVCSSVWFGALGALRVNKGICVQKTLLTWQILRWGLWGRGGEHHQPQYVSRPRTPPQRWSRFLLRSVHTLGLFRNRYAHHKKLFVADVPATAMRPARGQRPHSKLVRMQRLTEQVLCRLLQIPVVLWQRVTCFRLNDAHVNQTLHLCIAIVDRMRSCKKNCK